MRGQIEEARMAGDLTKALDLIRQESKQGMTIGLGHQYALTLMASGKWGDALEMLLLLVAKAPQESELWLNTAQCCEALGDWEAALRAYDAILKSQNPNRAKAFQGRGSNLFRLGMHQWGLESWRKALEADRTQGPSFMRSQILLALGDYEQGWKDYEGRRDLAGWLAGVKDHGVDVGNLPPEWDGESEGRVLVYGEQGVGDVVMFSRYLSAVEHHSGTAPMVICRPDFWGLVDSVGGYCDWSAPVCSLAGLLGGKTGYPFPPVTRYNGWFKPTNNKPRVGVCWKGSSLHTGDKDRSSPIDFRDALRDERWEIVSLQVGYDFSPKDYLETAELMRSLDAVVTVDTSVVHLAGTLGVPTVLIPPAAPEWRWGISEDTTSWYPSIRIVRRKRVDQWEEALDRAKRELAEMI